MVQGIVLQCDENLGVSDVLYNSYGTSLPLHRGDTLDSFIDPADHGKTAAFREILREKGGAFNWELNLRFQDRLKPLKFSGGVEDKGLIIIGVETNRDVPFLFEELSRINNEQANTIRRLVKQVSEAHEVNKEDESIFDEMTRLNNELANLQRELSRKNLELTKLNELKNTFLGMAAHDLRNPLANITYYADFIEEEGELSGEQKDFVQEIRGLSSFMLNLVNDLLDISTIEGRRIRLHAESFDLLPWMNRLLRLNRSMADRKDISIQMETGLQEAPVVADAGKLEQVMINLISNAVKYSHPGTGILITLSKEDQQYLISVRDEGQGIAADELPLLFRPFQRTSTMSTGEERSTGLGLYIVRNIIEAHGGKIWAESKKGAGSSFRFFLPAQTWQS